MIDESLGKNTEVKKIMKLLFAKNIELRRKIGKLPKLLGEEIKIVNCKKRKGFWEADLSITLKYGTAMVPVRVVERILKKEALVKC